MAPKKELKRAYYLAGILLLVGAVCYAAFPKTAPEQPIRMMFHSVSGKVLFNHQAHVSEAGYGLACNECHHHPEDAEPEELLACKECHQIPEGDEKVPAACLDCHDEEDVEETELIKSSDAFHTQCIGCHQEYGSGPEECAACHVLL